MTEEEIQKDKQERLVACRTEVEASLKKHQFGLTAEDFTGAHTKIQVNIQFVDTKQYDAPIAQPENEVVEPAPDPVDESPVTPDSLK